MNIKFQKKIIMVLCHFAFVIGNL